MEIALGIHSNIHISSVILFRINSVEVKLYQARFAPRTFSFFSEFKAMKNCATINFIEIFARKNTIKYMFICIFILAKPEIPKTVLR